MPRRDRDLQMINAEKR